MSGISRIVPTRRIPTSRGLVAASKNPNCELLVAMGLEGADERRLREALMGEKFGGEYGERQSAKRRGSQFEARLLANDAAVLKEKVGPLIGRDPASVVIRDFSQEFPGPIKILHAVRLHRFRTILKAVKDGKLYEVPDIIVQATVAIDVLGGSRGCLYLSPDMIVFDRRDRTFRVGEFKSFIVRKKNIEPKDLDNTRRQTAAGILGLADELIRAGLPVHNDLPSIFIFARPNGLQAYDPFEEPLRAEIVEVDRARTAMRDTGEHLAKLREGVESSNLADLAMDLKINLRERCTSTCLLSTYCARREPENPAVYGDVGVRALATIKLDEIPAMLVGDPQTLAPSHRNVRDRFERAAAIAGIPYGDLVRMIA